VTTIWIGLVVAGIIGAPCRYLVDGLVLDFTSGDFPWGTFAINASGSLLLGLITGAALYHAFPDTDKVILGTGFCGAYTTFSTWTFETVRLIEERDLRKALVNALLSIVTCGCAAGLGLGLASL
jgi:CrcB protein